MQCQKIEKSEGIKIYVHFCGSHGGHQLHVDAAHCLDDDDEGNENDGIWKKGHRVHVDAMITVDVRMSLWGAESKKPEDMWISSYIVMMVAYMSTALCAIQKTWR